VNVYWVEQTLANVPVHNKWLAESELLCLQRLHIPKRREDWRLGRWTAKRAVAMALEWRHDDASLKNVEILADPSGAPEVSVGNQLAALSISLSHRDGVAACAIARSNAPLGCDLELIETRSDAFVADYFTEDEQKIIAQQSEQEHDRIITTLWSAKESALKALRVGLRADTRSVNIRLLAHRSNSTEQCNEKESDALLALCLPAKWHPFQATFQNDQVLNGWWNTSTSLVRTFAGVESARAPIILNAACLDYSPCTP
jgi:4'-phosphopantetheinyl transferase